MDASPQVPGSADSTQPGLRSLLADPGSHGMPPGTPPYPLLRVPRDTTLVHEGAPAQHHYLVQAGHFKTVRNGEDGYEQVLDFVGRGEVLGCDGFDDGRYASGAVALEPSWVIVLPAADVQRLGRLLPGFAARWQAALARQLAYAGDKAWVMGAVGAEKRLARFIVMAARRNAAFGESPRRLRLPMCRRDVGSHLGLSHESVSRSFTLLAAAHLLRVDNREIDICDVDALRRFASSTRGYAALRRDLGDAPQRAPAAPAPERVAA